MDVIEESAAEHELDSILTFFSIDKENDSIIDNKKSILSIIKAGRLSLNCDSGKIRFYLASPLKLENGEKVEFFDFSEPTAGDLKCLDRYKKDDSISKTIHLVSKMTGSPLGVIEKISARDLTGVGVIAALFF